MEIWNKYQSSLKKLILIILICSILYLSITYLLPFFAPFVIALIVSYINEPVIRLLHRIKIPRKLAAIFSLLLTISALGLSITLGIIKLFNELTVLQNNVSVYISSIAVKTGELKIKAASFYNTLPSEITDTISKNLSNLSVKITNLITDIIQYVINTISSIPRLTVFIFITLLATYFISSDRIKIYSFFYRQLPHSWRKNMTGLRKGTLKALIGYFKAILILMGFTFLEVSIGLFVLDIRYAFLIALLVGLTEAIPVVGTGLIMLPWILWNFLTHNMSLAFGLSIVYILGVLIRQIMEPKIVGSQLGLHPLATLIAMYVGLEFFGVLGMFIGPISIIVVKSLQDAGTFKLWND